MGLSFRVAPGVRVRASSRGLSAGLGPRAARVHVGTRGVGVSSGVGPISGYEHLRNGSRQSRSTPRRRATYGPTKAQIAAYEREVKAAEREADIEKVRALEATLTHVHRTEFPQAARAIAPEPEAVDPTPIRERLEAVAGIPEMVAELGDEDQPPVAPDPDPIDRYATMRETRARERAGIPIYRIHDRIGAARRADALTEVASEEEAERRKQAHEAEQERLDEIWLRLGRAREAVAKGTDIEIAAERDRRSKKCAAEQAELDADWERLRANDPETTLAVLEAAFADNASPAAAIDCSGEQITVAMRFPTPEQIVPEKKPDHTLRGKPTLKKRKKGEINQLYLESMASNVLATVKEAFAVAPGTNSVQIVVIRRETEGKQASEFAPIYVGEFAREGLVTTAGGPGLLGTVSDAAEADLNLTGQAQRVDPLKPAEHPELEELLAQLNSGLADAD
jgi:hypothetical protein